MLASCFTREARKAIKALPLAVQKKGVCSYQGAGNHGAAQGGLAQLWKAGR